MDKPKIWVLASGTKNGGGSGVREMEEYTRTDPSILNAEIVCVTSNYPEGGVSEKARRLDLPFDYWNGPFTAAEYLERFQLFGAQYTMCSGWLRIVHGLDPKTTINIHPGPLPETAGLYTHHVHDKVMMLYRLGRIKQSAVTMHFITPVVDGGPVIARFPVYIREDDTPDTLGTRVNEVERVMQSRVLNLILQGHIFLNESGKVEHTVVARLALLEMGGMPRQG